MGALGITVANDIANGLLYDYIKSDAIKQTVQDKPLLRILTENMKDFPGGNLQVSSPVQGQFMSDAAGFIQGYSEDDTLTFAQAQNLLRCNYQWYEVHAGLEVSWTEMKKDGITVDEDNRIKEHPGADTVRIVTSLFQNRLDDFAESWARGINKMLWLDGSQDAKQTPGLTSILTDNPSTGTTGGLSRVTYPWWRHRTRIGATAITPSAANQTLTKTLRSEILQLCRYGGKPDYALCGSGALDGLQLEVTDKGIYTQDGAWTSKKQDLGMKGFTLSGFAGAMSMLNFEYDPTMDDLGLSKRIYVFDSRRLRLRPMKNEWNKVITPARPYQYMVFFKSMTNTCALECTQLNACGVYELN